MADVADTADLKVIDRNFGRRPMSDEDQRYTAKLMAKHGLNQQVCIYVCMYLEIVYHIEFCISAS